MKAWPPTWRRPGISAGLIGAVALLAAGFVYIASSPWLIFYHRLEQAPHEHFVLVFSSSVPASLTPGAEHFSSLAARWRYVFRHSSRPAWRQTLRTLGTARYPFQPAALIYTERWFAQPTLITATQQEKIIRLSARAWGQQSGQRAAATPAAAPEPDSLAITVPGSALKGLPPALTTTWDNLLREKLGFTATAPALLAELGKYEQVTIAITGDTAVIGIHTADAEATARWEAQVERWVIDEDRFRRPLTQTFRLPDGTIGREVMAGLPGTVWQAGENNGCRSPLPEKPALWACAQGSMHTLATYPWQGDNVVSQEQWEIAVGGSFLPALSSIESLQATGEGAGALGRVIIK